MPMTTQKSELTMILVIVEVRIPMKLKWGLSTEQESEQTQGVGCLLVWEAAFKKEKSDDEDGDDSVFVSVPSAKRAKKARKHSLKQAKKDNRPSAKKH